MTICIDDNANNRAARKAALFIFMPPPKNIPDPLRTVKSPALKAGNFPKTNRFTGRASSAETSINVNQSIA